MSRRKGPAGLYCDGGRCPEVSRRKGPAGLYCDIMRPLYNGPNGVIVSAEFPM